MPESLLDIEFTGPFKLRKGPDKKWHLIVSQRLGVSVSVLEPVVRKDDPTDPFRVIRN